MNKLLIALLMLVMTSSTWALPCDGHGESISIIDPTDNKEWKIDAKVFTPLDSKTYPVVFLLPPSVGDTILDNSLATNFCLKGMGAYVLNLVKQIPTGYEIPNFNLQDEAADRALAGIRAVMATLDSSGLANGKYGIVGASLGGILASYIAGSEPRIKASVLIAAGGNIPFILATSTQEAVKAQREGRFSLLGINDPTHYENILKPFIQNDPINVAPNILAETTLQFIMLRDTKVPTITQIQLNNRLNRSEVIQIDRAHVPGIVEAVTVHVEKISFFLLCSI